MAKKVFWNNLFLIIGSFIVFVVLYFIIVNFIKDARIFGKETAIMVDDSTPKPSPNNTEDFYKTYKYQRTVDTANTTVETKKPTVKPTRTVTPQPQPVTSTPLATQVRKISVEVINYTGIKNLAEEVRQTLEASGYEVSAGNATSKSPISTQIIERTYQQVGAQLKNILKIGKRKKILDPNSRFDATIILGDDFNP